MQRSVRIIVIAAMFLMACPSSRQSDLLFKTVKTAAEANGTFTSPLDATLSPDGKVVYFIASTPDETPAIFCKLIDDPLSQPTLMIAGAPLDSPLALDVTSDGSTLYIADVAAGVGDNDFGQLYMLPTSGGSVSSVASTAHYQPRSLTIINHGVDQIYFSGNDPVDGLPGIFKVEADADSVIPVAKGFPFVDPGGVAVARNGDVYVVNTAADFETTAVLKISGGNARPLSVGHQLGYPVGIALSSDDNILSVSGLGPGQGNFDAITRYDVTRESIIQTLPDDFEEPVGLHRGKNTESYAWANWAANKVSVIDHGTTSTENIGVAPKPIPVPCGPR